MKKVILVTGGAGFIGSNFIPYFCTAYPEYCVINLDKLTYAGDLANLSECESMKNYAFIHGDICDTDLVEHIFREYNIQGVIHFAAESHVDNSIKGPSAFVQTNVMGTLTLLEVARKTWMKTPFHCNDAYTEARFHHISTDEVFGTLGNEGVFTEKTPYAPNSPYSASKASADFLVRSYFHTYGLNVVTSNCSNNYGPKQHREKLIPLMIHHALHEQPLPVYGNGLNVRDWLYVLDHCKAIDRVFHHGRSGEVYAVGGNNEWTNIAIVEHICAILDEQRPRRSGKPYSELITYVEDRAGHDFRYAIDATKIKTELNWFPEETFATGIIKTVAWYLAQYDI